MRYFTLNQTQLVFNALDPCITGSKQADIKRMFKDAINYYGRVDVLVNNAGIVRDNVMVRMKPEQWQQVIDINLSGAYTSCCTITDP